MGLAPSNVKAAAGAGLAAVEGAAQSVSAPAAVGRAARPWRLHASWDLAEASSVQRLSGSEGFSADARARAGRMSGEPDLRRHR